MKKVVLCLLLIGVMSGCASTYQQYERGPWWSEMWTGQGEKGGYRDSQLSDDQFSVSYIGSKMDSADITSLFCDTKKKIRGMAMRRAAELTKCHQFRYFEILSEEWNTIPGCGSSNHFNMVTLQIKCYHANPPANAFDCYESKFF